MDSTKSHCTTNAAITFNLARFRFVHRPVDRLFLPAYKGAVLRGGFGYTFKDLVCIKADRDCSTCLIQDRCSYFQIFETPVPKNSEFMRKYQRAPHPFVLTPPHDERTEFSADDELSFDLILIGQAIDYLAYFIYTFEQLGQRGIGHHRSKYELLRVESFSRLASVPQPWNSPNSCDEDSGYETIYSAATKTLRSHFAMLSFNDICERVEKNSERPSRPQLTLRFLTPVRISTQGKLDHQLGFTNLLKALLRRIQLLQCFHMIHGGGVCGSRPESSDRENGSGELLTVPEVRRLLKLSESVETANSQLTFKDLTRYSTRQNCSTSISGFTGQITYHFSDFELWNTFIPFLCLGEIIHLGKGTSFGLGKYELIYG